MKVQDLSYKINTQRNSKTRQVAVYDKLERKHVHAARSAHRARLQALLEQSAWGELA